jgi:ABC-type uncharacterized transport system ATPase subunit
MSENSESHRGPLAVELHGISKSFPGVIANYAIELMVRPGTIHAIVGENGAGKSTLMNSQRTCGAVQDSNRGDRCRYRYGPSTLHAR